MNRNSNWACSRCGEWAYFDGRCGDGPVLLCGCDQLGPAVADSRMGSVDYYYPESNAKPIPVSPSYKSPSQKRNEGSN